MDVMGLPGSMPAQGVPAPMPAPLPGAGAPPAPYMMHDVTVVRRKKYGCARVEAVPPEEFAIGRRSKRIRDASYTAHTTWRTQDELIKDGYDEDQIKDLPFGEPNNDTSESISRDTVDENTGTGGSGLNPPNRRIKVTEHFCVMDYEENGKASLYRVVTGGTPDVVLKRDGKPDVTPADMHPFAAITPIIMPHRFFGRSVADTVMDIMRQKSSLLRGIFDNVYLANNQRLEVAESHAHAKTLDDLLNNRPGGVVRTKQPGGVLPIPNQPIGDFVFPVVEYLDATREWRTGVTRQGQGIDADALQNQSATAVNKTYSAAQARMKLIARIFAETGVKDLFSLLHATIRKNATKADTVRLRNKWVNVDPRDWKKRDDLTISVGLGSGGKAEEAAFWTNNLQIQQQIFMVPGQNLVKPIHIYNSLKKLLAAGGEKAIDQFYADPSDPNNPAQPAPPDPKVVETQAKLQMQQAQMQHDQQLAVMKFQSDQQLMQSKAGIEKVQAEADIATQDRKTQAEMALAERRFELDRELALIDANIKVGQHQADMQAREHDAAIKQQQAATAMAATKAKAKAKPAK